MDMRFSACNELFKYWEFGRVCECLAEIGYDGVEIAPFTLAESVVDISTKRRAEIRSAAADSGLGIVGFHWLLLSPGGLYVNHPDQSIRETTLAYYHELIRCCAELGGAVMINGSPKQRNVHETLDYSQAWDYAIEFFNQVAPVAKECNVTVCIEPLAPTETDFINTAKEAIRFAEEVDGSHVKMMLDAKAMSSEEIAIPEIIKNSAGWFRHVHANDPNLLGPGMGELDFAPLATALDEVSYEGWVSIEPFDYSPGPELIARKSLAYLRETFASA